MTNTPADTLHFASNDSWKKGIRRAALCADKYQQQNMCSGRPHPAG